MSLESFDLSRSESDPDGVNVGANGLGNNNGGG